MIRSLVRSLRGYLRVFLAHEDAVLAKPAMAPPAPPPVQEPTQVAPAAPAAVEACAWCKEPLDTRHPILPGFHIECGVRVVAGSVAHLERRCGCFVAGSTDNDPPGLTAREAALAAYRLARQRLVGPPN